MRRELAFLDEFKKRQVVDKREIDPFAPHPFHLFRIVRSEAVDSDAGRLEPRDIFRRINALHQLDELRFQLERQVDVSLRVLPLPRHIASQNIRFDRPRRQDVLLRRRQKRSVEPLLLDDDRDDFRDRLDRPIIMHVNPSIARHDRQRFLERRNGRALKRFAELDSGVETLDFGERKFRDFPLSGRRSVHRRVVHND